MRLSFTLASRLGARLSERDPKLIELDSLASLPSTPITPTELAAELAARIGRGGRKISGNRKKRGDARSGPCPTYATDNSARVPASARQVQPAL